MTFKPALGAVVLAPLLFLVVLAGGVRGISLVRGVGQQEEVLPPKPVSMKAADKPTTAVLQKVVGGQIGALQKKDYKKALSFAASDFQAQWKPDTFGQMITSGYPELENAKTVGFGPISVAENGTIAFVPVLVRSAQKKETRFLYVLSREPAAKNKKNAGTWRVSGCQRQNPPQTVPRPLNEA